MKEVLCYGISIDSRPAFFDQYDDEETAVNYGAIFGTRKRMKNTTRN